MYSFARRDRPRDGVAFMNKQRFPHAGRLLSLSGVLVILLVLAVTVALLLGQWRGSGTGTGTSGMPAVGRSVGWLGHATVPG